MKSKLVSLQMSAEKYLLHNSTVCLSCEISINIYKKKVLFLYSTVLYDCSEHFTLHLLADLFILIVNTISNFLRSTQPCCNYCVKTSFTYPPLSVARYSFVQLNELSTMPLHPIIKGVSNLTITMKTLPIVLSHHGQIWGLITSLLFVLLT